MVAYILRKLLEKWIDSEIINESFSDELTLWRVEQTDYVKRLLNYYCTNFECDLIRSYLRVSWWESYKSVWSDFGITWNWLKKRFYSAWLPVIYKNHKWMEEWVCKKCNSWINYYRSKNKKFCSMVCYRGFSKDKNV